MLGCGTDRDYPAAHRELAARIRATGLTVSEYAPGVEPTPWRFPARNRIVAGLARATVVVEARERSGALISADFALEQARDFFRRPGRDLVFALFIWPPREHALVGAAGLPTRQRERTLVRGDRGRQRGRQRPSQRFVESRAQHLSSTGECAPAPSQRTGRPRDTSS